MSYALQSKNGIERNKLFSDDTGVHDWYRFVLSYPPHLVRKYIHAMRLDSTHTILDPFCGTGTTLVESKKNGIPSVGIESTPVVQMAARTKVDWMVDSNSLLKHAEAVAKEVEKRLEQHGSNLLVLDDEKANLIIKSSISPLPLHKSLILLEVLDDMWNESFIDIERTAFAKQLVKAISNLHFGPEVGVSRKKKNDAEVVELWLKQIHKIAADLKLFAINKSVSSKVHLGDSREIGSILQRNTIDAVITSPPYPNEKDYTRTTRLESVLLDFMTVKADLRRNKESMIRSNTRNIFKGDDDEKWILNHRHILDLAESIESRRIELGKTSGFERHYHKVVTNYFGGMARHLAELKSALRPGAQLAYVVGDQASFFQIPIRTGKLLSDIAIDLGYQLVNIELFRTRLSTATKAQLREEVVLLRWNG